MAMRSYEPCLVDFDDNNDVDFSDYAKLAENWQVNDCNEPDWCSGTDLNYSGAVDFSDLSTFTKCWLNNCCN